MSVWPVALLWALLMAPLLYWGLPDRSRDDLLFGGDPAWEADRYGAAAALEERRQRQAGADTDLNPLADRDRIVHLTTDEAARAEILLRYRLYSRQPDEMITLMALQRMQPPRFVVDPKTQNRRLEFDFDPKLYQYGGGYIYLVGAAIAASSLTGYTQLTTDVSVYLEQPELFARFYVVCRLVVLIFGALLLVAAWKLARRAAGRTAAWLTLLFIAATPVFITGVLEAKPHIPSACLVLWATLSALDYQAAGRRRDALRLGLQAGYAFGLVMTGVVALVMWPALLVARWRSALHRRPLIVTVFAGVGLSLAVYLVTNPYIPYNVLFNRNSLASNVSNSWAMYADQMRQAAAGAARVGVLLWESCGPGVLVAGLIGFGWLLRRRPRETLLAAAAGLAMLLISILLGAGKPAEYARFLILPVCLLCVAAAAALADLSRGRRMRLPALGLAIVVLLLTGSRAYLHSFIADARGEHESRYVAARFIEERADSHESVTVLQRPAPYAVPPFDLAHREVYLLPPAKPPELDRTELPAWLVFTADDESVHRGAWWTEHYRPVARFPATRRSLSRIAWANKPVFVYCRSDRPVH